MKIGQTSVVFFISKLGGSALGFFATIYFARELGAEVMGVYALVITVVGWLILASEVGIGQASTKRISEGEDQGEYLVATLLWVTVLAVTFSIGVILLQGLFERYISEFEEYISVSVIWFIVLILFIKLSYSIIYRFLKGQRMVHVVGLLNPVQIGAQSLFQLALVIAGFGLAGMLVGYAIGGILVGLVGLYWIQIRPAVPSKRHFRSLFDYAKFSWLGSLKSRTFNEVDILLLGVFVPSSLVGVYSVAWSIAKFLELFGGAVSQTMFPEISYTSSQETKDAVRGLIEDALAYSGLIATPGLVGGGILAERLLRIYGPEFVEGASVLVLLVLATLLYSYLQQFLNGLNGIDRPNISFRINAVFIVLNAGLNGLLIPVYGIEGAAVASVVSVGFTLALAYRALGQLVEFRVPVGEIGRQVVAALFMGAVILACLRVIEEADILKHNFVLVVGLVGTGAVIYFTTLLGISPRFRETVGRNLPIEIPYIS